MLLYLVVPLLVVVAAVVAEYSGLDLYLARYFFDPATETWPLKDNFFTAGVLHKGGRDLVLYVMVAILLVFVLSFLSKRVRPYRKGAGYMVLGTLLGPAIVALLKHTTHIYTPWNLEIFGGDKPYIRLFDSVPAGLPVGNGFPGGHSSGGFAFVSLFFLFSVYRPRYRYFGLAFGLFLGALFAAAQEMRGAHFLSHDLFSLVICWYAALAVYGVMYLRDRNRYGGAWRLPRSAPSVPVQPRHVHHAAPGDPPFQGVAGTRAYR